MQGCVGQAAAAQSRPEQARLAVLDWLECRTAAPPAGAHKAGLAMKTGGVRTCAATRAPCFYFLYNQRGHQVMRIIRVDGVTGNASAVLTETSATFIDYQHKGYLHWLSENGSSAECLWASERSGYNHVYLYDLEREGGCVGAKMTVGGLVRRVEHVDAAKRRMWFQGCGLDPNVDPYYVYHYRVDFDGTGLVCLTPDEDEDEDEDTASAGTRTGGSAGAGAVAGGGTTHAALWSPCRAMLIDSASRVDRAPVHTLRDAEDGRSLCVLETGSLDAMLARGWRPPERFVAAGRDGATPIYGLVFRPKCFGQADQPTRFPVVEHIYAGPQDHFVAKGFLRRHEQQSMADNGFIVVRVDGMGTNWRSKAFHDVCWRNLRDAGLPDRVAWIKQAAHKFPEMDISRVGIYGGSAGGANAMSALLHHGNFYHVAVADCGCHDSRMDKIWWNEAWMGEIGRPPLPLSCPCASLSFACFSGGGAGREEEEEEEAAGQQAGRQAGSRRAVAC